MEKIEIKFGFQYKQQLIIDFIKGQEFRIKITDPWSADHKEERIIISSPTPIGGAKSYASRALSLIVKDHVKEGLNVFKTLPTLIICKSSPLAFNPGHDWCSYCLSPQEEHVDSDDNYIYLPYEIQLGLLYSLQGLTNQEQNTNKEDK